MELSKAGVLFEEISSLNLNSHRILISNWGSELILAKLDVEYFKKIKSLLKKASYFTAECERDYLLANEYGFEGEYLAKIPAGGGFLFDSDITKCSSRKNIIVKGYGGNLGRADISLKVVEKLLMVFENTTAFVYSCTPDVIPTLNSLKSKFGNRIEFSTTREVISREEILSIFNNSRIYIGCSRADGLSTSFVEALATGTYPIQTNTSCASELIELGFMGSITGLSETEIYDESVKALTDDNWVDKVTLENYKLAVEHFEFTNIQKIALTFYEN
jgi:glycosyltransferase involved in cell wall biosynthesis